MIGSEPVLETAVIDKGLLGREFVFSIRTIERLTIKGVIIFK